MQRTKWYSMSSYNKADFTYKAIRFGREEEISIALSDTQFMRNRKIFPLHIAVEWENLQSLKFIIKLGYHIDSVNSAKDTALHVAIRQSKYVLAKYMIKQGASIEIINTKKESALSIAAKCSVEHFLKFVLRIAMKRNTNEELINARYGPYGTTLLGMVDSNYKLRSGRAYKRLLRLGADINKPLDHLIRFSESNLFLIRVAATGDNPVTLQVLHHVLKAEKGGWLKGKFKPESMDQNGDTILHALASRNALGSLILVLQRGGIDLEARNKENKTPLNCAIEAGHQAVFNCLVNHGSKLDTRVTSGKILPFDQAVEEQFIGAIQVMVKEGVKVEECEGTAFIKDGGILGLDWESCKPKVSSLFDISRIAIRKSIVAGNGNINWKVAEQLKLPKTMLMKIISPFPIH